MLISEEHRLAAFRNFFQHCSVSSELHPGLIDVVENNAVADFNRALVRGAFSQTRAQESCFSDTIASDYTRAFAGLESESEVSKQPTLLGDFAHDDSGVF